MYILLSGAKKNAGDFLIFNRAKSLLEEHLDEDFTVLKRWEKLDDKLDLVNSSRGIIICGGPGYGSNFYRGTYPLTEPLEKLEVPVIPLGLGWGGTPINMDEFQFTETSLNAINYIHSKIEVSSVRDTLTQKLLARYNVNNVVLSGCPAWYSIPDIDKEFIPPREIKKIVITTPAKIVYASQTLRLFNLIKRMFPKAEVLCSFHRGIKRDKYTKRRYSYTYRFIATYAKILGFNIQDVSYGSDKIEKYREFDLHVGYRVHSHIYFLSIRKPSFLLQEDGRGKGLSLTLKNELDVSAYDPKVIKNLKASIKKSLENEFEDFFGFINFMRENYYKVMVPFIEKLK